MAREVTAWYDDKGTLHASKEAALLSDIEAALGKIGDGKGFTPGLAKLIADNRDQLMPILQQFDPVAPPAESAKAGARPKLVSAL